MLQMVNHGITTGALFILLGLLYEPPPHLRDQRRSRASQKAAPVLRRRLHRRDAARRSACPASTASSASSSSCSARSSPHRWWAVVAAAGVILAAALPALGLPAGVPRRARRGRTPRSPTSTLTERLVMVPLLVLIVFLGIYPKPVLDRIEPSVDRILDRTSRRRSTATTSRRPRTARELGPDRGPRGRRRAPRASTPRVRSPRARRWRRELALLAQVTAQTPTSISADPSRSRWPAPDRLAGAAPAAHPAGRRRSCCSTISSFLRKPAPRGIYAGATVAIAVAAALSALPLWAQVQGWSSLLWWDIHPEVTGPYTHRRRHGRHRRLHAVRHHRDLRRGRPRRPAHRRLPAPRGHRRPRVLRPHAAVGRRRRGHGDGATTSSCCSSASRRCRSPSTCSPRMHLRRIQSQEAGIKYFVLGGVLVGVLPLRHRPDLRRHRLDEPGRHQDLPGRRSCRTHERPAARSASPCCSSASASRSPPCRSTSWSPDVYDGAPTPGRRLHGLGGQGRRLRRHGPRLRADVLELRRRLAADHLRPRRRSRWSSAPSLAIVQTERQAHAGVLVDQPRRVHPDGRRGRRPPEGNSAVLFYLAAYTFMVAGSFGVVTLVGRKGDGHHSLERLPGPGPRRTPMLALRVHRVPARPGRCARSRPASSPSST